MSGLPIIDDSFFTRMVICHPDRESYFRQRIKTADIKLITSKYMDMRKFIVSKDCKINYLSFESGLSGDDFANNVITMVPQFEIL